jgi:hypothetical protein
LFCFSTILFQVSVCQLGVIFLYTVMLEFCLAVNCMIDFKIIVLTAHTEKNRFDALRMTGVKLVRQLEGFVN